MENFFFTSGGQKNSTIFVLPSTNNNFYSNTGIDTSLGGNYQETHANKASFDDEIIRRWTNKITEDQPRPPKRKFDDMNSCEIAEFILDVLENSVEAEREQKQKIIKLALKGNEYMVYIWKTIEKQNKKEKIYNFIRFVNLEFDVNLTVNINSEDK